eukprot:scaffold1083_cov376-Prasinococcus_capsulatus_cf.AAC.3
MRFGCSRLRIACALLQWRHCHSRATHVGRKIPSNLHKPNMALPPHSPLSTPNYRCLRRQHSRPSRPYRTFI